ncbi:MAG: LysR family transcriptional regulator [Leucobacter sp.]
MVQRFGITLTQLTYFTECAKALNMTAASQELHVAQSAVSTAISHLERSLGTTLFIRQHSKGLILTAAGENLLRDTQRLFRMLDDTIDTIQADQQTVSGSITIACFSTLAPFLLPQLIDRLQKRHPELSVSTLEGDYEDNLAALRGGRAEIAIGYLLTDEDGIEHETVGMVPPHVIVRTDHPLAGRSEISLSELADDPFVLLDLPDSATYFLDMLRSAGIEPRIKYRSSSYETVRSMVATGLGFSILNQRPGIDATYAGNRIATLEIADQVEGLEFAITSLAQIGHSARARAVAAMVHEIMDERT